MMNINKYNNFFFLIITEDMSVEDVLKEVLKIVEKVWKITRQINFDIFNGYQWKFVVNTIDSLKSLGNLSIH